MKKITALIVGLLICTVVFCSEAYFTSKDVVRDQVIKQINLSNHTIDIAIYSFTSKDIAQALEQASDRGVRVRIVRDKLESMGKSDENGSLARHGIEIHIIHGKSGGIMHNKFAIFDKREIFTGSYNWTDNAENKNYENAFFDTEIKMIQVYDDEFERLWKVEPLNK